MVRSEIRVRYADTDAMGVAYHANYLVWFEVGRTDLMREWGLPYTEFEQQGIFVPVVEANVRWLFPARYDDRIVVETRVAEFSPAKVRFAYRILRAEDGKPLCEGQSLHAFITAAGRPVALPRQAPALYEALKAKFDAAE